MPFSIRRYRPADYEAVVALHRAGIAQINPGQETFVPAFDADLDDIPASYLDIRGDFLVGEFDGVIIAIGAIRPKTDTCGEIRRMRTRRDLQGRGYGRLILEKLTERAREFGYDELFLDTLTDNASAIRFYEAAGFTRSGGGKFGPYEVCYYSKQL